MAGHFWADVRYLCGPLWNGVPENGQRRLSFFPRCFSSSPAACPSSPLIPTPHSLHQMRVTSAAADAWPLSRPNTPAQLPCSAARGGWSLASRLAPKRNNIQVDELVGAGLLGASGSALYVEPLPPRRFPELRWRWVGRRAVVVSAFVAAVTAMELNREVSAATEAAGRDEEAGDAQGGFSRALCIAETDEAEPAGCEPALLVADAVGREEAECAREAQGEADCGAAEATTEAETLRGRSRGRSAALSADWSVPADGGAGGVDTPTPSRMGSPVKGPSRRTSFSGGSVFSAGGARGSSAAAKARSVAGAAGPHHGNEIKLQSQGLDSQSSEVKRWLGFGDAPLDDSRPDGGADSPDSPTGGEGAGSRWRSPSPSPDDRRRSADHADGSEKRVSTAVEDADAQLRRASMAQEAETDDATWSPQDADSPPGWRGERRDLVEELGVGQPSRAQTRERNPLLDSLEFDAGGAWPPMGPAGGNTAGEVGEVAGSPACAAATPARLKAKPPSGSGRGFAARRPSKGPPRQQRPRQRRSVSDSGVAVVADAGGVETFEAQGWDTDGDGLLRSRPDTQGSTLLAAATSGGFHQTGVRQPTAVSLVRRPSEAVRSALVAAAKIISQDKKARSAAHTPRKFTLSASVFLPVGALPPLNSLLPASAPR